METLQTQRRLFPANTVAVATHAKSLFAADSAAIVEDVRQTCEPPYCGLVFSDGVRTNFAAVSHRLSVDLLWFDEVSYERSVCRRGW